MKDIIFDIVKQTIGSGVIELVKVTGTTDDTAIDAVSGDQTVVLNAKLHNPSADLIGEFGMGNLSLLNGICGLYNKEGSTVEVEKATRNGNTVPDSVVFKDAEGNNDKYRLMSKEILESQLETVKFKGAKWDVSFEPSKAKVQELAQASSVYSGIEPTFSFKSENGNLVVVLGGESIGHSKRVFAPNQGGNLRDGLVFPLNQFLSILKSAMGGVCVLSISNQGACQISVDTGIGLYNYILPALTR